MERPRKSDPAIVAYAANSVAEMIVEDWDEGGCVEDWAKALGKEMRYSHRDGYELARELERYHSITPDSRLVELLDDASGALDDAYADALEKWVKMAGWQPQFAVGDRVTWRGRAGAVNGVKEKVATYYFAPDDEAPRFAQGGGYLVMDDELTALAAAARQGGDVKQAPAESPQSGGEAATPNLSLSSSSTTDSGEIA